MIIKEADGLATVSSLTEDLARLGVRPGMALIVHSSMKALGCWVAGGPAAVVLALEQALGEEGTLVMPAQTADLSEPSNWSQPPVPEAWWETIRREMPPFDPSFTPSTGMGAIAETFRKQEGTLRSSHPQTSFTARGPLAAALLEGHALTSGLGEQSPLARLYERDGWVLLLGVGYDSNTSLHLAEYRAVYPGRTFMKKGAPIQVNGRREWTEFEDLDFETDDFAALGEGFERDTGNVRRGKVAGAEARLMPMRQLVDYAVCWMERHRPSSE
ncbi:AAC(3) family N-acetyltransferase [Paenibacillus sp. J31TS4]|uniref:aminoglycoside N(3)-acetyltransferase n=1 Tax=Paenibacillus sp. J31TS4 TaxID=2807195 RepID=UPI001B1BBFA6|nr:AAC(3) family N-acetyltransferase [Paenibacillus sp. J31TS4]GIP39353.1 AAC(3) family N-acetyltransferase [Paenibacillus sp. J31TS4]